MVDIKDYINIAQTESIEKAEQYRIINSPKTIYKFMPFYDHGNPNVNKRNIETIIVNQIWAPKFSSLNDPFEFKAIYLDEDKILKSGNEIDVFQNYLDYINNSFLVVSFSSKDKGIL